MSRDKDPRKDILLDISVQVGAVLGRTKKTVRELSLLQSEDIIELDSTTGDDVAVVLFDRTGNVGRVVVRGRIAESKGIVRVSVVDLIGRPEAVTGALLPEDERSRSILGSEDHSAFPAAVPPSDLKLEPGDRYQGLSPGEYARAPEVVVHSGEVPANQMRRLTHLGSGSVRLQGGGAGYSSSRAAGSNAVPQRMQWRVISVASEVDGDASVAGRSPHSIASDPRECDHPAPASSSVILSEARSEPSGSGFTRQIHSDGPALYGQTATGVSRSRLLEIGTDVWTSLSRPLTVDSILQAARIHGVSQRIQSCPADSDSNGGWQLRTQEREDSPKAFVLHDPETGEGLLLPNFSRYSPFQQDYDFAGAMPTENFGRISQVSVGRIDAFGRYVTVVKGRLLA